MPLKVLPLWEAAGHVVPQSAQGCTRKLGVEDRPSSLTCCVALGSPLAF